MQIIKQIFLISVLKPQWDFFNKLGLDADFLRVDPANWNERDHYKKACQTAHALSVVNDHAERGVALVKEYSNILTKDEEQFLFIMQIVQEHRKRFPDAKKVTLRQSERQ